MGLKEKAEAVKQRTVEKIEEAMRDVVEPGEKVLVSSTTSAGPSWWVSFLLLGPIGILLLWKNYFVSLTDQRLVFIRVSLRGRAQGLAFAYPRTAVSVVNYIEKAGPSMTDLLIRCPDGNVRRLHFNRAAYGWKNGWEAEAMAIRDGLSGS